MVSRIRSWRNTLIHLAWGAILGLVAVAGWGIPSDSLALGQLTLVPVSEGVPYAYWYYVPEHIGADTSVGIVWHATPGGTRPDDEIFWARFDLRQFLACKTASWPQRTVSLPEVFGLALISVAVPMPPPAFYADRDGLPLGQPVSLSSLGVFEDLGVEEVYCDPDLKALASIDDFRRRLADADIPFDPRIFLTGVYSGAEWAHRFALLHPDELRAVAPVCGNVNTLPTTHLDDKELPWPLGLSGWEKTGRPPFDRSDFLELPYLMTASWHDEVWYGEMTPAEQGARAEDLARYVDALGAIPPERASAFAEWLFGGGTEGHLVWSDGGHGWVDSARYRVFEFFAGFPPEPEAAP